MNSIFSSQKNEKYEITFKYKKFCVTANLKDAANYPDYLIVHFYYSGKFTFENTTTRFSD